MRTVICDIETESLTPKLIWVIGCKEYGHGEVHIFQRPDKDPSDFLRYAEGVDRWVGHNFLNFDLPAMRGLIAGLDMDSESVIDTLVVSRLLNYGIEGGHSLDVWGRRLKHPKPTLSDFSHLSQEMIDRVTGDVLLNEKLYHQWVKYIDAPEWQSALWVEHQSQMICKDMTNTGFYFDIDTSVKLYNEITGKVDELLKGIMEAFPPRLRDGKEIPFNPGSPQQIVERLFEAGWKPTEKTKGHIKFLRTHPRERDPKKADRYAHFGYTVSEENIATLPATAPEAAKSLVEYLTMASRKRKLTEWHGVYNKDTHRIHGAFLSIGTWPHRMAHHAPNMGNNPKKGKPYGAEMRALWCATPGRALIGTDMDQAHLRILAHMCHDENMIGAFASGDKTLFTDIHSLNAKTLGLDPATGGRDLAKTFIYTFLNGGKSGKISALMGTTKKKAQEYIEMFNTKYPGLPALLEGPVKTDAARGYFVGIDGRKVMYDKEHGMLAGYLQNAEVIMMKRANIIWRNELKRLGIPFWQVNFVHDEWQTETLDDVLMIETVKQVQLSALREVGEIYGITCPIAGESKDGYTWAETH